MRLKLFALLGIALFSFNARAQDGRFSLGLELALPVGDFADQTNLGVGGTIRYELPLSDGLLSFTGTAGLISFGGEEISYGIPNFLEYKINTTSLMIPIQVGLKYYPTEVMNGFYAGLETGVHINMFTTETETIINGSNTKTEDTDSDTHFGLAPGIGYHLSNFDIGLRYQMLFADATVTSVDPVTQQTTTTESSTTYSYLGFRIAYVFGGE